MVVEKVPDAPAESSPASGEPLPVPEDDFALPEDVKDEKSRARFQKLVDRAKTAEERTAKFADFGEPEQLSEFVAYTRQLEQTLEQTQARIKSLESSRDAGESKTEEQKALEATKKTVERQIRDNVPLLDKLEKEYEERQEEKRARVAAITADAIDDTATVMKDYGMPVTKQSVLEMCKTLEVIIKDNPRMALRFERNPERSIREAMGVYLDKARVALEGKSRVEQERAKQKLGGVPRAHGGGGGPGPGKPTTPAPRSAAEAGDRFGDFMKNR